ncbi:MAG: UbiA family prenyltransferase, partial [Actinomycetaceae bacterium]|nr:UbiA family prenyltransferase [Actinomycetaceae bacterium]
ATLGTTYTQMMSLPWEAWIAACATGFVACGVLMANNIRDIPTDKLSGKKTLAVRLGDTKSRLFYDTIIILAIISPLSFLFLYRWSLIFFLPAFSLGIFCIYTIHRGHVGNDGKHTKAQGRELIPVLRNTGFIELAWSVALLLCSITFTL